MIIGEIKKANKEVLFSLYDKPCEPPPGGWLPDCPPEGCPSDLCSYVCANDSGNGEWYCKDLGVSTAGAYHTMQDCLTVLANGGCEPTPPSSSTSGSSSTSVPTTCMCEPDGGPVPSDDPSAEDCSLCQKTWVCDISSGPIEHPGSWGYYQNVWSTNGPTQEQVEEVCKESFNCYGGCYGYWDIYYQGQFSSYKACTDECVDRYYCPGWNPYGGDPCRTYGPDIHGEKNCDKCQIIGHQCDPSYGKIPVYGDPNAPLPGGLMSPSETCFGTINSSSSSSSSSSEEDCPPGYRKIQTFWSPSNVFSDDTNPLP